MPLGLKRYQSKGDDHFVTFSCFQRKPYLATSSCRDTFLTALEQTRRRYRCEVLGYVVMPEHVHLLVSEPEDREVPLAKALQALKLSVSKRLAPQPFWQTRYYDFNVFTHDKRVEKLKYMHRNPVTRGLVERPEDWPWSSYRQYLFDEPGPVEITRVGEQVALARDGPP
ncbi:MAG: transposase [Acidobacteriota bacterium]|nr:transposase [Acidobacteriota bacterium]